MAPTTPRPLHHIAVVVGDIEAAIRWYDDVLGYRVFTGPAELTLETDDRGQRRDVLGPRFRRLRIAHLSTAGGCGLELFEPIDPPFERRPEDVEFWRSGTFHFCRQAAAIVPGVGAGRHRGDVGGRIGRATRLWRRRRRPAGAAAVAGTEFRRDRRDEGGRPTTRKRRARPAWIRPAVRVPGGRQGAGSARPGTRAGSA